MRALEAILIKEKDLKEAFVCSMLQHPSFSASLIRLLTSALLRPNLEELPAAMVMAQVADAFLNENRYYSHITYLSKAFLRKGHLHSIIHSFFQRND